MLFVVLCPGSPEGSTGSGSGFKASQKTGQRLKVSSDRLGEARNRTCDPWFTRHRFIPYTTAGELNSVQKLCGTGFSQFLLLYVILGPILLWESYSCRPPLISPAGSVRVRASGKTLISWKKS